ncbi:hypothetical protein D3C72_481610 [compost metagenome]
MGPTFEGGGGATGTKTGAVASAWPPDPVVVDAVKAPTVELSGELVDDIDVSGDGVVTMGDGLGVIWLALPRSKLAPEASDIESVPFWLETETPAPAPRTVSLAEGEASSAWPGLSTLTRTEPSGFSTITLTWPGTTSAGGVAEPIAATKPLSVITSPLAVFTTSAPPVVLVPATLPETTSTLSPGATSTVPLPSTVTVRVLPLASVMRSLVDMGGYLGWWVERRERE